MFVKITGCFEIIGVLIAWYLIMKTKRKWMWTGIFNILAGIFASAAYLIPPDCMYTNQWSA